MSEAGSEACDTQQKQRRFHHLAPYGYMLLWIFLSATVIMINKFILDPGIGGFPFPLTLTATHMLFCSAVAWLAVRLRVVNAPQLSWDVVSRCILPIGGLFAATLWTANAAYLTLSVSFIQMLKASMPLLVYAVGTLLGTERLSCQTWFNLVVVVAGVITASYGEVVFVLVGVACQVSSLLFEATRLTLVQLLLQSRGIKLNPITTLYYVAPVCFCFLVVPWAVLEAGSLAKHPTPATNLGLVLLSAVAAFALNCSVFLLIGKTSALTMNIAGVVKDIMLIGLSVSLYGSVVTRLQVAGYSVALAGAFVYNFRKMRLTAAGAVGPTQQQQQQHQPAAASIPAAASSLYHALRHTVLVGGKKCDDEGGGIGDVEQCLVFDGKVRVQRMRAHSDLVGAGAAAAASKHRHVWAGMKQGLLTNSQ